VSNIAGDGRVFIATWLPTAAQERFKHIVGLVDHLHMSVMHVPEGIDTPVKRRQSLDAIEEVCERTPPLVCSIAELGVMGNGVKTLVANVIAMGGSCFYADLIETLERRLGGHHLKRPFDFLPHVSLVESSASGIANINDMRKFKWTANEITMQFGDESSRKFPFTLQGRMKR
jgi:hypothetical protein